jgi:superfamily II DNA or RNA helicase
MNVQYKRGGAINLYPHNQRAYASIRELWAKGNKAAVIQATGTGKSYLIMQCIQDLPEHAVAVVVAPSNYILNQLLSNGMPNVCLLTYTKLSMMSAAEIEALNPALIVLDEFHRCGAETWGKGVQAILTSYPEAKLLGTSATPIRYLDGQRDMSDELFGGSVAVNLSVTDAIVQNILPMPKYIAALYTFDEEVASLKDKIDASSNDDESKAALHEEVERLKRELDKSKGIPQILKKHAPEAGKYIVFCKDKAHLQDMRPVVIDWFKQATGCRVESYSIFHDADNNSSQHEAFRDNRNADNVRLMFSIEMYNEGIHIDDVTGVVLLRPTVSPIIYYQQIGRALQAGGVEKPIIFDFVNNRSSVRTGDLAGDLKESVERDNVRRIEAGEKKLEIPDFTIFDETLDVLEMFGEIEGNLRDDFDKRVEELTSYIEEHGRYPKRKSSLGYWVSNVRASFKGTATSYILTEYRIGLLKSIDFMWDPLTIEWLEKYEATKEYITFFSGNPPKGCTYNGVNIGNWARRQMAYYSTEKMAQQKIDLLEEIGFVWDPHTESWNKWLDILSKYKAEFDQVDVPLRFEYEGFKLGSWCQVQRKALKEGRLKQGRIDALDSIGFDWTPPKGKRKGGLTP